MSEGSPDPSTHLEPPSKTTELEDPGASEHVSSSDEDHFSDASEGHPRGQSSPQSGRTSPVPRTRVERVDTSAQHGEVPGTEAYDKREQDALPDEITVVPEGSPGRSQSPAGSQEPSVNAGSSPVPQTMDQKIDTESPTHSEVTGTEALEKGRPDVVSDAETSAGGQPIPETKVSQVDTSQPEEELPSRPRAHQRSPSDPMPDTVETVPDPHLSEDFPAAQKAPPQDDFDDDQGAGDDFDEFVEEQDDMGDDDFGDFDDGFQEPSAEVVDAPPEGSTVRQPHAPLNIPPLVDFESFGSTSELLNSLEDTLDNLLPSSQDLNSLPPVEPIPDSAAIFSTERSLSLWSQLVAPPPLQPQNWVKSRIRRLFLVSLGVPVDLDEILPASKQKKLVLPSIDLDTSGATTTSHNPPLKEGESPQTDSPTASGQAPSRQRTTRRGAGPPPDLDLPAVRRLCATTDAALSGLTDEELKQHVQELERVTGRASTVLEYWLKRRDGLVGEKEAFEGVIENLVSHVRRVRK